MGRSRVGAIAGAARARLDGAGEVTRHDVCGRRHEALQVQWRMTFGQDPGTVVGGAEALEAVAVLSTAYAVRRRAVTDEDYDTGHPRESWCSEENPAPRRPAARHHGT
jgi:hypothetical protein